MLKPFGLVAGKGGGRPFVQRVQALVAGGPLQEVAEALLSASQAIDGQISTLSRRLLVLARQDNVVKRLMSAPGVAVLVALTTSASSTIHNASPSPPALAPTAA